MFILFVLFVAHLLCIDTIKATNDITWCRIDWDSAFRKLSDDISVRSKARDYAPLIIPTKYRMALLTTNSNITLNITVTFSKHYLLSAFPCDTNTLQLSIKTYFSDPKYTNIQKADKISEAANISTNIVTSMDNINKKLIFQIDMFWCYTKWMFTNWNFTLIFYESLNNINISSQPLTIMNVPKTFKITGNDEKYNWLYGEYALSTKAQWTLFSTINTNGVYFQLPEYGTTVFCFIYMGYIYPLSQWVFFDNYGELAKPMIASNQSINDNFFVNLPQNKVFIDNDNDQFVFRFEFSGQDNIQSDRIYNPYLECSVTQYLVNYMKSYKFVDDTFEINLHEFSGDGWYNIPQCIGRRCVFGVRLNRFDHFLVLEYNNYHYPSPKWKLIQSWMFCWSLEWWLSAYSDNYKSTDMNTTDELPTTIHYLPVSDCSLHRGNRLKQQYGANQFISRELFEPWLDGLYLLIQRVVEIKNDCRLDPMVLSLSRELWGAVGQCGRISYVDFDPQIFGYVVTQNNMETNLVEWMKLHHLLAPSTKLGDQDGVSSKNENGYTKTEQMTQMNSNGDHGFVIAAVVLVAIYIVSLLIYISVKYYRANCAKYQSVK